MDKVAAYKEAIYKVAAEGKKNPNSSFLFPLNRDYIREEDFSPAYAKASREQGHINKVVGGVSLGGLALGGGSVIGGFALGAKTADKARRLAKPAAKATLNIIKRDIYNGRRGMQDLFSPVHSEIAAHNVLNKSKIFNDVTKRLRRNNKIADGLVLGGLLVPSVAMAAASAPFMKKRQEVVKSLMKSAPRNRSEENFKADMLNLPKNISPRKRHADE